MLLPPGMRAGRKAHWRNPRPSRYVRDELRRDRIDDADRTRPFRGTSRSSLSTMAGTSSLSEGPACTVHSATLEKRRRDRVTRDRSRRAGGGCGFVACAPLWRRDGDAQSIMASCGRAPTPSRSLAAGLGAGFGGGLDEAGIGAAEVDKAVLTICTPAQPSGWSIRRIPGGVGLPTPFPRFYCTTRNAWIRFQARCRSNRCIDPGGPASRFGPWSRSGRARAVMPDGPDGEVMATVGV